MIRSATAGDVAALVELHREALPGSILTRLGRLVVARYYRFALASPLEHVWVADEGRVVAGAVLSEDPASLMQRFGIGRKLFGKPSPGPEVTQIFTDASQRGKGLGAHLLRTCEETLRTRGLDSYFVHTQRDDNAAGIRFYEREGFVQVGKSRSFGEAFIVMKKDL